MSKDNWENPDETRERDERGRFLPGNVTSKTGRSPGRPPVIRHIRELAREQTETAFETLMEIALSGESESARVAAIKEILDRGWGKSAQPLVGADLGPIEFKRAKDMSDEELAAIASGATIPPSGE